MKDRERTRAVSINRYFFLWLLTFTFALGVFAGAAMYVFTSSAGKTETAPEGPEEAFRFIRSSTAANNAENTELRPFRYKVNELIGQIEKRDDASTVSVYFRDLNNGNWFGMGEQIRFSSLRRLQVPLMISYFKWAETNPVVLRKTLMYTGREQAENETDGEKGLEPGKAYPVNDLMFRMIAHNDAAAYALLNANLPASRLDKTVRDLDVEYEPQSRDDSVSLGAFASFYRVLFNASYLSEEMSEKALRYLSKDYFQPGMAAALPPGIELASKEGRQTLPPPAGAHEQGLYQVHEFGIIYHPTRPFLLGVVARGRDAGKLTGVIRDITRLVYEEVDKQS